MMDGLKCSYFDRYRGFVEFHFHRPKGRPGWERAAFNYCRCLQQAKATCALVMENDVVFAPGWWDKLLNLDLPDTPWVLDLCNKNGMASDPAGQGYNKFVGDHMDERGHHVWCCTNGAVYGKNVSVDDLTKLIQEKHSLPYDLAVGLFIANERIPVYFPSELLMEHIGGVSSLKRRLKLLRP
jgi:hypothetical protein